MVLPECLSVAVDALYLFDPGVREFCIVVTGGVVMARGEVWLYTSILLLARVSVGEFSRLNFRQASFYCFFCKAIFGSVFSLIDRCLFISSCQLGLLKVVGVLRRGAFCFNPLFW